MNDEEPQSNPVGRPVKYSTVEELQNIINEYFEWCDNRAIKKADDTGKEFFVSFPAPYTMSGLARRLGLSRQGLIEYSQKDEFSDAIKDAREKIHEDVETRLMDGKAQSGSIFNLKNNFGWKDEQVNKNEHSGVDGEPISVIFKSKNE